jgi:glycosyltransferase involved in cell wall biosynthesis
MKSCEGFVRAGADVELLAVRRSADIDTEIFRFYGVADPFRLTLLSLPDLRRFGAIGYRIESLWFALRVAGRAQSARPGIIYARDEKILWLLVMLGFRECVWETHDRSWNFFSRSIAARVRMVVSTSGRLREFYIGRGVSAEHIIVAAHAIDPAEFASLASREKERNRLDLPSDRNVIAYIGKFKTMGESKGVEELIEAAAPLVRSARTFLLLVGLNEDEYEPIQQLLHDHGFGTEDYALVGHVSHARVPAYMRAADVLVMNYPRTEHYESIMSPVKTLEYMASGTPIIASDLRSIRDVLDKSTAMLVPPDDVTALRGGILAVLAEPDRARDRADAARLFALGRSWERRAAAILAALPE